MQELSAEVESIEKKPDGSQIVTVRVTRTSLPPLDGKLRAKARALVATGLVNRTVDAVQMGEILGMTELVSSRDVGVDRDDAGKLVKRTDHEIRVVGDN